MVICKSVAISKNDKYILEPPIINTDSILSFSNIFKQSSILL